MQFNLDGDEILSENEEKHLGVTIDCQLKLNIHISEICKKKNKNKKSFKAVKCTKKNWKTFI